MFVFVKMLSRIFQFQKNSLVLLEPLYPPDLYQHVAVRRSSY